MPTLKFKEYCLDIPKGVYFPSEDTELMLETLEKETQNKHYENVLEIGSGNGLLSFFLYDKVNFITTVDINPVAIEYLNNMKQKYSLNKLQVIQSNLFEKIAKEKFDLIVFNPPYVPTEEIGDDAIDLAVNGGKQGREIIDKFIVSFSDFLSKKGECFLLISSLNNLDDVINIFFKKKLHVNVVSVKNLFFEKLYVLKIKKS